MILSGNSNLRRICGKVRDGVEGRQKFVGERGGETVILVMRVGGHFGGQNRLESNFQTIKQTKEIK